MRSSHRFTVVEYAKPYAFVEEVVRTCAVPSAQVQGLLVKAAERISGMLALDAGAIVVSADRVQFRNFAGLLVLARGIELEVPPKFLGDAPGWREDFFLLATLSHHGRLLDSEGLRSASGESSDLMTLIGRSLVEMYWREQRRPLRTYRRLRETTFALEGEFDFEDLRSPEMDGIGQVVTSFTRQNPYNAVIAGAAGQLAQVVSDIETRARLRRVSDHLPNQVLLNGYKRRRLPSRLRSWQPAYDLSQDVLRGFGGSYDPKYRVAPGFVLRTWQVWEHLVSISLRSAFGTQNVMIQPVRKLGTRYLNGKSSLVNVLPDAIVDVEMQNYARSLIVDAKYKGQAGGGALSVANSDIYEVLAFSRASSIKEAVLIYPCSFDSTDPSRSVVGRANEFSKIVVDDVVIRAVEIGVSGISERGGLKKFTNCVRETVCGTLSELHQLGSPIS